MRYLLLFLVYITAIWGADYDCIIIGTSPIPLFEALYQHAIGKKVLILDEAAACGGAWKSIDICGVEHVDVGCHEIGGSAQIKEFLEEYGGCNMVYANSASSFYFSKGCYELINNLQKRIANSSIQLLLNCRVDRISYDEHNQCTLVECNNQQFTAMKVYTSAYSFFLTNDEMRQAAHKSKYYHLYLLLADPTPPRFSYQGHGVSNCSRMMNLTSCNDLTALGRQLIVFQTYNEDNLNHGERFLQELKMRNLVDSSAYILCAEPYIYEQWPAHYNQTASPNAYIEKLNTFDFRGMAAYIPRWKEALLPYRQAVYE